MSLRVGQCASLTRRFTEADVVAFSRLTLDDNPLHLDEAAARASRFGRRVVHGFLSASLISAVLGTRLPGPGTIYLSQSLNFRHPVFIGDEVTARVQVTAIDRERAIATLSTTCTNQDGRVVADGEAVVMFARDGASNGA